jgi:hypothetical protein
MTVSAREEAGVLRGRLQVNGPTRSGRRVEIVLAEKGAIYPGLGATVVHRMVARSTLTDAIDGVRWTPTNGYMEVVFERSLQQVSADNLEFLTRYEQAGGSPASRLSTQLDREQLVVVAILREPATGIVDQAVQCDVINAAPRKDGER